MTPWLIVRTDLGKEEFVARAIERLGCEAWVPMRFSTIRPTPHSKRRVGIEVPLLATIVFAALPEAVHGDLREIRHLRRLERDSASRPLQIHGKHLWDFRHTHEAWHERERIRLMGKRQGKPEKPRARTWAEVRKILFPDLQLEDAD